eukprot:TRINITY_DN3923_c1_g1_i1.p1 TRINITY_DN3923_c1_g1~~TRINITY_DN3923_c1_g1_i1.p1  ORF type:complete len:1477 (-),score=240.71 TRINITY_DN3923_c1_g1_i1:64-4296(-)
MANSTLSLASPLYVNSTFDNVTTVYGLSPLHPYVFYVSTSNSSTTDVSSPVVYTTSGYIARLYYPLATTNFDGKGNNAGIRFQAQNFVIDEDGTIYFTDPSFHVVRSLSTAGLTTTLAGTYGVAGDRDGQGAGTSSALFRGPTVLALSEPNDPSSSSFLYVFDGGNYLIRKIDISTRRVTTLAGTSSIRCPMNSSLDCDSSNVLPAIYGLAYAPGASYIIATASSESWTKCSLLHIDIVSGIITTIWTVPSLSDSATTLRGLRKPLPYGDRLYLEPHSYSQGALRMTMDPLKANFTKLIAWEAAGESIDCAWLAGSRPSGNLTSSTSITLMPAPSRTRPTPTGTNMAKFIIFDEPGKIRIALHDPASGTVIGTLTRPATVQPYPTITTPISTNNFSMSSTYLSLVGSDPDGNIFLSGQRGSPSSFMYIIYGSVPKTPSHPTLIGRTQNTLHIMWTPRSHLAMTSGGFSVRLRPYMSGIMWATRDTFSDSLLWDNLQSDTEYEVCVAAKNELGSSSYSTIISYMTLSASANLNVPTPVLLGVDRTVPNDSPSSSSSSLLVSWSSSPTHGNKVRTGHELAIYDSTIPFDGVVILSFNETTFSYLFTNLYPMWVYAFCVRTIYDDDTTPLPSSSKEVSDWSPVIFSTTTTAVVEPFVGLEYGREIPGDMMAQGLVEDVALGLWDNTENIVLHHIASNMTFVKTDNKILYIEDGLYYFLAGVDSLSTTSNSLAYSRPLSSLFVGDARQHCIQKIEILSPETTTGVVSNILGVCDGSFPLSNLTMLDGPPDEATLPGPTSLVFNDEESFLFFIDQPERSSTINTTIRSVNMTDGYVSTIYHIGSRSMYVPPGTRIAWSRPFGGLIVFGTWFTRPWTLLIFNSSSIMHTIMDNRHLSPPPPPSSLSSVEPSLMFEDVRERRYDDALFGSLLEDDSLTMGVILSYAAHPSRRVLYILQNIMPREADGYTPITLLMIDVDRNFFSHYGAFYPPLNQEPLMDLSYQYGLNFNRFNFLSIGPDEMKPGSRYNGIYMGGNNRLYFTDYKFKYLQWNDDVIISNQPLITDLLLWNYTHIGIVWNTPAYYYLVEYYRISAVNSINAIEMNFYVEAGSPHQLIFNIPEQEELGTAWNVSVLGLFYSSTNVNSSSSIVSSSPHLMVQIPRPYISRVSPIVPRAGGTLQIMGYYLTPDSLNRPSLTAPLTGSWGIVSAHLGPLQNCTSTIPDEVFFSIIHCSVPSFAFLSAADIIRYVAHTDDDGGGIASNMATWSYEESSTSSSSTSSTSTSSFSGESITNILTSVTTLTTTSTMTTTTGGGDHTFSEVVISNITIPLNNTSLTTFRDIANVTIVQVEVPSLQSLLNHTDDDVVITLLARPGLPSLRRPSIISSMVDLTLHYYTPSLSKGVISSFINDSNKCKSF